MRGSRRDKRHDTTRKKVVPAPQMQPIPKGDPCHKVRLTNCLNHQIERI